MKRIRQIPTILAFLILGGGVAVGVFLIKNTPKFFIRANPEIIPKKIKITNVSDKSFVVSWITEGEAYCFLQYGAEKELSFNSADDRDQISGQKGKFFTHYVTVKNLNPSTNYFFKINCEGRFFDNNGQPYQVKTGPVIQEPEPPNDVAYGKILKQDGSPASGVIIYLSLANAAPLSSLTTASGSWAIPLNLARLPDLSSWARYDKEASVEEILVEAGPEGGATAIGVTKNDNPLPTIILGQNFDFRRTSTQAESTPPPASPTPFSRFSVGETPPVVDLKIINPLPGEEINTLRPEILGTGPAGEVATIVIESPEVIRGEITINNDGSWSWVPPTNLSPGSHTVTVTLANGKKVSHSFTVVAAGTQDLPSFTASPSATLIPTPSPTATPTPSFTPTPTPPTRVSQPSTESGLPRPGVLTPTFLFIIMGSSLVILGLLTNILFRKI